MNQTFLLGLIQSFSFSFGTQIKNIYAIFIQNEEIFCW